MANGFGVHGDAAIEYILVEAAMTLDLLDPDLGVPLSPPEHPLAKWHHEQREFDAAMRRAAEEAAETDIDLSAPEDDDEAEGPLTPIEDLSDDVYVLHDLKHLATRLARRDLELGQLADAFWRGRGWQELGYATENQYCRERPAETIHGLFGMVPQLVVVGRELRPAA